MKSEIIRKSSVPCINGECRCHQYSDFSDVCARLFVVVFFCLFRCVEFCHISISLWEAFRFFFFGSSFEVIFMTSKRNIIYYIFPVCPCTDHYDVIIMFQPVNRMHMQLITDIQQYTPYAHLLRHPVLTAISFH